MCGVPINLIEALVDAGINNITVISSNCGAENLGVDVLMRNGLVKKLFTAYTGGSDVCEGAALVESGMVEFVPQGLMSERIRAAKSGIPAFYVKSGIDSSLFCNREIRTFDGSEYFLEYALHADLALIKAHRSDPLGNLIYRRASRNFNAVMAGAARYTIAEVEEIVAFRDIDRNGIHTPGIYVDRVVSVA